MKQIAAGPGEQQSWDGGQRSLPQDTCRLCATLKQGTTTARWHGQWAGHEGSPSPSVAQWLRFAGPLPPESHTGLPALSSTFHSTHTLSFSTTLHVSPWTPQPCQSLSKDPTTLAVMRQPHRSCRANRHRGERADGGRNEGGGAGWHTSTPLSCPRGD